MVQRGTTPINRFNVNIDLTSATELYVTYKQLYNVKIEKTQSDCTVTSTYIDVPLTQEDTLALNHKINVEMQIRAKFSDGTAVASNVMISDVGKVLKEGII